MNPIKAFIAIAPVLFVLVCVLPGAAHAAAPTWSTNEVVSNAAAGADTQAVATTSTTANVPQTKATRTLTIANGFPSGTVSGASASFVIGTCTITLSTNQASDTDCSNGNAGIATSTDSTATLIATRLKTITGLTDTGHGAIAITASTTDATSVVFTTSGTESSATNITFTNTNTGGAVSSPAYATVTGVIPVAQVWTYTPSNVEIGDTFTAIINGTTIHYTATAATVANVTAGLTAAINASAQASAVTATDQGTRIDVTSNTAGTAFTLTKGATNLAAVAEEVSFTPENVGGNYRYEISINGNLYKVSGSTVSGIVAGLQPLVNADPAVSCSEDGASVTCTADVAGTAFTYATYILTPEHSSSSHSSGSSGSSSSGATATANTTTTANSNASSSTSLEAQLTALKAQLATLMKQAASGASASFSRDLTLGASGADVKALQVWLNTHGFPIASTGPGSTGNETMTFGGLTQAALAKWQASVGISPAAGYFGTKTRAYLAAH